VLSGFTGKQEHQEASREAETKELRPGRQPADRGAALGDTRGRDHQLATRAYELVVALPRPSSASIVAAPIIVSPIIVAANVALADLIPLTIAIV